ncbi:MAG: hypothetical protein LC769_04000 [Chloroflexi bacterium]|nr:hypothetical protein [Chloroflexota bacterium]
MRKIQDAHRFRSVQVNEALDPLRPIHHHADLLGPRHPTPMQFARGRIREGGAIRQAREVG